MARDEDIQSTDQDPIFYLVGVVSFGPRRWFVSFFSQLFLILIRMIQISEINFPAH